MDEKGNKDKLVKSLYAKYAPNDYSEDNLNYIKGQYKSQEDFAKAFYTKYAPNELSKDKLDYINNSYSWDSDVKKEDGVQPAAATATPQSETDYVQESNDGSESESITQPQELPKQQPKVQSLGEIARESISEESPYKPKTFEQKQSELMELGKKISIESESINTLNKSLNEYAGIIAKKEQTLSAKAQANPEYIGTEEYANEYNLYKTMVGEYNSLTKESANRSLNVQAEYQNYKDLQKGVEFQERERQEALKDAKKVSYNILKNVNPMAALGQQIYGTLANQIYGTLANFGDYINSTVASSIAKSINLYDAGTHERRINEINNSDFDDNAKSLLLKEEETKWNYWKDVSPKVNETKTAIKKSLMEFAMNSVKLSEQRDNTLSLVNTLDEVNDPLDALYYGINATAEMMPQMVISRFTFGVGTFLMEAGNMYTQAFTQRVNEVMDKSGVDRNKAIDEVLKDEKINTLAINTAAIGVAGLDYAGSLSVLGKGTPSSKVKMVEEILKTKAIMSAFTRTAKVVGKVAGEDALEVSTEIAQQLISNEGKSISLGNDFGEGLKELSFDDAKELAAKVIIGQKGVQMYGAFNKPNYTATDIATTIGGDNQIKELSFEKIEKMVLENKLERDQADNLKTQIENKHQNYRSLSKDIPEASMPKAMQLQDEWDRLQEKIEGKRTGLTKTYKVKQSEVAKKISNLSNINTEESTNTEQDNGVIEEETEITEDNVERRRLTDEEKQKIEKQYGVTIEDNLKGMPEVEANDKSQDGLMKREAALSKIDKLTKLEQADATNEIDFAISDRTVKVPLDEVEVNESEDVDFETKGKTNKFTLEHGGNRLGTVEVTVNDDGNAEVSATMLRAGGEEGGGRRSNTGKDIGAAAYQKLAQKLQDEYGLKLVSGKSRTDAEENLWKSFVKKGMAKVVGDPNSENRSDYSYEFLTDEEIKAKEIKVEVDGVKDVKEAKVADESQVNEAENLTKEDTKAVESPIVDTEENATQKTKEQERIESEIDSPDISLSSDKSTKQKVKDFVKKWFYSQKNKGREDIYILNKDRIGKISSQIKIVENTAKDLRKVSKQENVSDEDINSALRGEKEINELPERTAEIVSSMRNQIDYLTRSAIDLGLVPDKLIPTFEKNIGTYLTRSYRAFDDKNWINKIPKEVKTKAFNFIKNEIKSKIEEEAIKKNPNITKVELDEIVNNAVKNRMTEMLDKDGGFAIASSKLGSKDLSAIKQKKEIPEPIRALLGEYTNPLQNYAKSIHRLANFVANGKFLNDLKEIGVGTFFFEANDPNRPLGFDKKIAAEGSEVMSPLNGLYTSEEVYNQLNINPESSPAWLDAYMSAMGKVKYTKTILSYVTHLKNVYGNIGFLLVNSNLSPKEFNKSLHTVLSGNGFTYRHGKWKVSDSQKLRDKYEEYQKLGVVAQSTGVGEIKSLIQQSDMESFLFSNNKGTKFQKISNAVKRGLKGIENAYQAEDDFFKIIAFENEMEKRAKAIYGKDKSELTNKEYNELSKSVSEIIRDTYPTYDIVPDIVHFVKKFPLMGTFVSFEAESIRVLKNSIGIAYNLTRDKNPEMRKLGRERFAGIASYMSLKYGLIAASMLMLGIDDEEDDDVKQFVAPWMKNGDLIYLNKEKGKYAVVDLGSSDPYGSTSSAFNVIKKMARDTYKGKTTSSDIANSVAEAVGEQFSTFLSEDILTAKLSEFAANRDEFGRQIWNKDDSPSKITSDVFMHFYNAFEPGSASSIKRYFDPKKDLKTEVAASVLGLRAYEVDVAKQLSFITRDIDERLKNARKPYLREKFSKESTPESIAKAEKETSETIGTILKEASDFYMAAERLGLSRKETNQILKDSKIKLSYRPQILSGKIKEIQKDSKKKSLFNSNDLGFDIDKK